MQLQDSLARFRASGIAVVAISTDSVETLAAFASEHGITYPLLADVESRVIRAFGILNTLIREDEAEYGIPFPGSYLVGSDGRVVGKSFHREYRVRETAPTVLRTGFGVEPAPDERMPGARVRNRASGVEIEARLLASSMAFMQRADLYLSFSLPTGTHLYGWPTPAGYQALEVHASSSATTRVGAATFPPTRTLRIAELNETFEVFEGQPWVRLPIVLTERPSESVTALTLEITVHFQACTDESCSAPTAEVLHLTVPLEA